MEIKIHCKYDQMVPIDKIIPYDKNPNKHGQDQIERLAKNYAYLGVRHPIIVCKDRKVIAAGHCRRLSGINAGMKEFPVVYQKFETDEEFYAFVTSDNGLADFAELDFAAINAMIPELGPDFDLDWLGIQDFKMDFSDKEFDPGTMEDQGQLDKLKTKTCPECGHEF